MGACVVSIRLFWLAIALASVSIHGGLAQGLLLYKRSAWDTARPEIAEGLS